MARQLRHKTKKLPLEKACIFITGRKHTSDPKKDLKKQIGAVQAKAYYTSRGSKKGGMDAETFDTIAWDDTETALEGTSTGWLSHN